MVASVFEFMQTANQKTTAPYESLKKEFEALSPILGYGDFGVVFEADDKAIKVYSNKDHGYNNYVRVCMNVPEELKKEEWIKHLPQIHMFEKHEHFNVVVMERLVCIKQMEKKFKGDQQDFVYQITDKPFKRISAAAHEAYGRLNYKGYRMRNLPCDNWDHFQVVKTLDDAMTRLVHSCLDENTDCDLNPSNLMFRENKDGQYDVVLADPFCRKFIKDVRL